jgi:DNA-binding transcriptional regulator GbsR (MarR family)
MEEHTKVVEKSLNFKIRGKNDLDVNHLVKKKGTKNSYFTPKPHLFIFRENPIAEVKTRNKLF